MQFTSFTFILFFVAGVLFIHAKPEIRYQHAVLTILNVLFIASYITGILQIIPMFIFLLWMYLMGEVVRLKRTGVVLFTGILTTLILFIFLKRFAFLPGSMTLPFPYLVVGLSYILFRGLQIMIDMHSGNLKDRISPLTFFNYTCNFLSFISGPIQRYEDFAASYMKVAVEPDPETVFSGFSRIVTGFIKLSIVAASADYLFINFSVTAFASGAHIPLPHFMFLYSILVISYMVYLYYNFSGYMDIVIGIGRLMGQDLPENFNKPFAARNFLEYWQRWHMTLSNWFKFYVFNPLLKLLVERFPSPAATPFLGVVAFFVTFLIMGLWHGTTAVFILYGLFMGMGASANKLWQLEMVKRLGKKGYKALSERPLYIYTCRGLTFSYLAVALTCFWRDMPQMIELVKTLGVFGGAGCFILIGVVAALGMLLWDAFSNLYRSLGVASHSFTQGLVVRNLMLAARILLIVGIGSLFNKAPEFVYKAF